MARARVSVTSFLYSFGYGGITSFTALYADANGVTPKAIYLTHAGDRDSADPACSGGSATVWGYKRVFMPCLVLITAGLTCLAFGGSRRLDDRVGHPVRPGLRHRIPGATSDT